MEEKLRYTLTVRLFRGEKCFGPGIAELLGRVDEAKSLRAAAQQMGMAYSKAWRIIKECEAALGFHVLHSTTGGHGGGGAELTDEGRDMLTKYRAFTGGLNAEADRLMKDVFGD